MHIVMSRHHSVMDFLWIRNGTFNFMYDTTFECKHYHEFNV